MFRIVSLNKIGIGIFVLNLNHGKTTSKRGNNRFENHIGKHKESKFVYESLQTKNKRNFVMMKHMLNKQNYALIMSRKKKKSEFCFA
jgi:hypothetical protein